MNSLKGYSLNFSVLLPMLFFSLVPHSQVFAENNPTISQKKVINNYDLSQSYRSYIEDLSDNGKIALGYDNQETSHLRAKVFSGNNWEKETLIYEIEDNFYPIVKALSGDGSVIGGLIDTSVGDGRAFLWYGKNFTKTIDLGTLKTDNTGYAKVNALNSDGSIAAGWAFNNSHEFDEKRAVIWSGKDWKIKTELERFKPESTSEVLALSANGKVAAGSEHNDFRGSRPVIWFGDNWSTRIELGSEEKKTIYGEINTLSANGNIAGGCLYGKKSEAVIWYGKNWKNKKILRKLDSYNDANTVALSSDGLIVAGNVCNPDGCYDSNYNNYRGSISRAVIWSGFQWDNIIDLGALKTDNTGNSKITALSADGTIVAGWAETDSNKNYRKEYKNVIWKIKYPEKKVIPAAKIEDIAKRTIPATKIEDIAKPIAKPVVVAKIDVENTKLSMARLGNDAIGVTSLQTQGLHRLLQNCYTDEDKFCYGVRQDFTKQRGEQTTAIGLKLGYGISDTVTVGASVDKSLARQLPQSYKTDGTTGVGIFANWTDDNWFVETAAAWQKDKVKVERPLLSNTEAGSNKTTMDGMALSFTAGYDFGNVSAYGSLRHHNVSRDAYVEKNAEFAASFDKLSYKDSALAIGAKTTLPITDKLYLSAEAEIEQQLDGDEPTYAVSMPAVGKFSKTAKVHKTRGRVQAGLGYNITPEMSVSFTPYYERSAFGYDNWGTSLQLNGQF